MIRCYQKHLSNNEKYNCQIRNTLEEKLLYMHRGGNRIESETLKTSDLSKDGLLHNIWLFVYRAFGNSEVKAKLGTRTRNSSALGRGRKRSSRSKGRHPFQKKINHEFGCAEVGKHDVLDDGMVKLPKTITDMLRSLVEVNPQKINEYLILDWFFDDG